jgi:uncharacterized membrane protein YccC
MKQQFKDDVNQGAAFAIGVALVALPIWAFYELGSLAANALKARKEAKQLEASKKPVQRDEQAGNEPFAAQG